MRPLWKNIRLSTFQIIIYGHAGMILLGALLLMLPISSTSGQVTPFIDTLFTATSSACVTGLVVYDTGAYWSFFGTSVIIILIQIGGLGVVTTAVSATMFSGRKISLMQRSVLQESIAATQVGGIVRLTSFILRVTAICEISGALLMFPVFAQDFGIIRGLGYSFFHSISAFCNAGFDLMGGKQEFSSLTSYVDQPVINIVIMLLIIIGGIGFLTWEDIKKNKFHFHNYRLQTKVVLVFTIALIAVPALFFYFFELNGMSGSKRVFAALFQAVTPRTAGFNTIDEASLSETGRMLTIVMMLIGGSPGSTAGGMKTTTAAVLIASCIAVFRHMDHSNLYCRRLKQEVIRKASAIFIMYITLFLGAAMIISRLERLPLLSCMFETASAIGTVGLTLGITPTLGTISKILLIFLMFFGRVGGLTMIYATVRRRPEVASYPQEDVTVG